MILKRFDGPRGTVQVVEIQSELLHGNPLGDPAVREVAVYLPPGYETDDRRYATLYDLVGYTGSGLAHVAWKNFTENVPERMDRLIHEGAIQPMIVVFPDCFTALGGNQYIDSSAIGPYASFLTTELVPFVDRTFRTLAKRESRGVFGKSSGGYGAMIHGMRYPETWGGIACHSGDMYFEFGYLTDAPACLNVYARHEHSVEKFLEAFHGSQKPRGEEIHALMFAAMAATYDPDPEVPLGFHMPVDLYTGELDMDRWRRWLAHDPVRIVEECKEALDSLRMVYFDCGFKDQYHLHYGARILHRKMEELEIDHHYEEFDDNHSGVDYRMDRSLPLLSGALDHDA